MVAKRLHATSDKVVLSGLSFQRLNAPLSHNVNKVGKKGTKPVRGMYLESKKISLILLLLQYPIAFYDGLTTIYALLIRPDFATFETIKKV